MDLEIRLRDEGGRPVGMEGGDSQNSLLRHRGVAVAVSIGPLDRGGHALEILLLAPRANEPIIGGPTGAKVCPFRAPAPVKARHPQGPLLVFEPQVSQV